MAWAAELRRSLNEGLLPQGYYVLVEQHAGRSIADVLTLHSNPEPLEPDWLPPDTGGIALANAPPRVQRRQTVEQTLLARRRSLAIRHVSGHRLIALIEIIEHLAVGSRLPEMPLFLRPDRYVNVPLEPTYQAAYRGTPAVWREVLESGGPQLPPASGLPHS